MYINYVLFPTENRCNVFSRPRFYSSPGWLKSNFWFRLPPIDFSYPPLSYQYCDTLYTMWQMNHSYSQLFLQALTVTVDFFHFGSNETERKRKWKWKRWIYIHHNLFNGFWTHWSESKKRFKGLCGLQWVNPHQVKAKAKYFLLLLSLGLHWPLQLTLFTGADSYSWLFPFTVNLFYRHWELPGVDLDLRPGGVPTPSWECLPNILLKYINKIFCKTLWN